VPMANSGPVVAANPHGWWPSSAAVARWPSSRFADPSPFSSSARHRRAARATHPAGLASLALHTNVRRGGNPMWNRIGKLPKLLAGASAIFLLGAAPAASEEIPTADPDKVGMSAQRLERIGNWLESEIAAKKIPGAVVLVA